VSITGTPGTPGSIPVASVSYTVGAAAATVVPGATASVTVTAQGTTTVTYLATDTRGQVGPTGSTTIRLDSIAPTVTCPAAPTFLLNQPGATLTATVGDAGSGPAATTVTVAVPTGVAGTLSVPITGTDVAGNTTTRSCTATVTYRVSGFEQPIDNGNVVNTVKAGQTIPVKWTLTDFANAPVSDPVSFVSLTTSVVTCGSSTTTDEIEVFSTGSGLQYLGAGRWQFNWKTPKSQAGCVSLRLNLTGAPAALTASFKFR
jgi:hypothetical protein